MLVPIYASRLVQGRGPTKPVGEMEGRKVIVGFPDGEQVRGVVVAQWDNTWYHIQFSAQGGECRFRDQVH
jgi:hypothetical protein